MLAFLHFERLHNPQNARKLAKSLLNTNRDQLILWDAYASMEFKLGKMDEVMTQFRSFVRLLVSSFLFLLLLFLIQFDRLAEYTKLHCHCANPFPRK